MSGHQLQRRQFTELHPKDQTIKLNRKARIESNWSCNVQECLPLHIRPRMELKKGAKARVGDIGVSEEIWWNWSVELLRSLEELSTMTATKLPFAQELLHLEVTQRQQNPKHPQRKIVELLLGDVQRVIDGMRRNQQQQNMSTSFGGMDEELDDNDGEYEGDDYEGGQDGHVDDDGDADAHGDNVMGNDNYTHSSPVTHQQPFNIPARAPRFNPDLHSSPAQQLGRRGPGVNGNRRPDGLEVQAIEIRARAMRLRSQATGMEAAAVELEADAADLRAQMKQSWGQN